MCSYDAMNTHYFKEMILYLLCVYLDTLEDIFIFIWKSQYSGHLWKIKSSRRSVRSLYEQSARMMDIAYVTAAVFDILTGFLRTCFSGDVHSPKKDSCWCKCKHRNDVYHDKNSKAPYVHYIIWKVERDVIISVTSSYYSTNNLSHRCRVLSNIEGFKFKFNFVKRNFKWKVCFKYFIK